MTRDQGAYSLSRRNFCGTLAGVLLAPRIALALDPQPATRVSKVGLLATSTQVSVAHDIAAFRQELHELGYVEGKTVLLELRFADGMVERIPQLARELVALKPDVIVATTDIAIASVRRMTQTIPIVMAFSSDPAGAGFVASLARPGGNVTGLSTLSPEVSGKRLELLREVVPGLDRVALLWNPDARGNLLDYRETEVVARSLHVELQSVELSSAEDLDRAFFSITSGHAQGLIVTAGNPVAIARRGQVTNFAQRSRLPSIYAAKEFVDEGGLMSYGASTVDLFRRAAIFVDRILKGARPADLAVEQPAKFDLVINLKTAKTLGVTIPQSLLRRADEVIQ
jgi:putative ABC transport system substrate-binding protein